ncbi:DUF4349 domain-containing protein [Mucilaginibacter galii]|nr:DUF4349 domain-containing protein [Mucilaginibacter galii]
MPPPPPPTAEPLMVADPGVKSIEEPTNENNTPTAQPVEKKIIKEGEISIEANNIKAARKALTDSLTKLGGYVSEESENNDDGNSRKNYVLSIRIPAQHFERFLSAVSSAADHIESKSIRIKDVTTEFIDITTRLKNKTLLEDRYKALLQKATKMADVLEVEDKLTEIRTDIETTQGQLNYLNKQVAYSSLQITLFSKSISGKNEGNSFGYRFTNALSDSWQLIQSLFFGLITYWPLVLIIVLIVVLLRRWRRRKIKSTI